MTEFVVPMLARSSHKPNSGVGCVMNLMSWEQGRYRGKKDARPGRRYDDALGYHVFVQESLIFLNDHMCRSTKEFYDAHGREVQLLCPKCSGVLIDLAHALEGSGWVEGAQHPDRFFRLLTSVRLYATMSYACDRDSQSHLMGVIADLLACYREMAEESGHQVPQVDQAKVEQAYQEMTRV